MGKAYHLTLSFLMLASTASAQTAFRLEEATIGSIRAAAIQGL